MAELRWHPLTKDWVMIASHRQNRPQMTKEDRYIALLPQVIQHRSAVGADEENLASRKGVGGDFRVHPHKHDDRAAGQTGKRPASNGGAARGDAVLLGRCSFKSTRFDLL